MACPDRKGGHGLAAAGAAGPEGRERDRLGGAGGGVSFRHAVELLRDGMPGISSAGAGPKQPAVRKLASPLERLDALTRLAAGYVKASGVPKTGACHLFGHTMATLMLEGGAELPRARPCSRRDRAVATGLPVSVCDEHEDAR